MQIKAVDILNNHSEDATLDLIGTAKKLYPTLKLVDNSVIFIGDKFIFQSDNIENIEFVLYGLIVGSQQDETPPTSQYFPSFERRKIDEASKKPFRLR